MAKPDLLEGLNPEQLLAVTHGTGPLLVVAGAGTGKTTVITRRIAWLITEQHVKSSAILALTFTDKAAAEMESRLDVLVPYGQTDTWISTFHAFGERLLRRHAIDLGLSSDFRVLSGVEQALFIKQHLWDLPLSHYRPLGSPTRHIEALLSMVSRLKDELVSPAEFRQRIEKSAVFKTDPERLARYLELADFYETYTELLHANDYLDFGDLIMCTIELLHKIPSLRIRYQKQFHSILIDEYQDTNHAQHQLMKLLTGAIGNVMVVGDDDQAIYAFRGAALNNILEFRDEFPTAKTILLTHNYRSGQTILDHAYRLITHNNPDRLEAKYGLDKRLIGQFPGHAPTVLYASTGTDEVAEVTQKIKKELAAGRQYRDIAILARAHTHLTAFEDALVKDGFPVVRGSRGLYEQPEIQALLALLETVAFPGEAAAVLSAAAAPTLYGVSMATLGKLHSSARQTHTPLIDVLASIDEQANELNISQDDLRNLRRFRDDVHLLSKQSAVQNVGELLFDYLKKNGVVDALSKDPFGNELRIRNLVTLFSRINQFLSASTNGSAGAFIEHIRLLKEFGDDPKILDPDPEQNAIHLLTIHAAKGLEFPIVFVVSMVAERFPSRAYRDAIELPAELLSDKPISEEADESQTHRQEERRLAYVAITRAKEELYLSLALDYGGAKVWKPSPFLFEALAVDALPSPVRPQHFHEQLTLFTKTPQPLEKNASKSLSPKQLVLSASKIENYLECPAKYWAIDVLGLPIEISHPMIYGTAIHAALAAFLTAQQDRRAFSQKDLTDAFTTAWRHQGFVARAHDKARFAHGVEMLNRWHAAFVQNPKPVFAVEQSFRFLLAPDVTMTGRFDVIYGATEDDVEISDFKTGTVKNQKEATKRAADSLQLALYSLAWKKTHGHLPKIVSLEFVEHDLRGTLTPSESWLATHTQTINAVVTDILSGVFTNTDPKHSCQWCIEQK